MSFRSIISLLILVAAVVAGWFFLRDPTRLGPPDEPPTEPPPAPQLTEIAGAYRAQADGTITISAETPLDGVTSVEDVEVSGRVRMHYLVYPDQSVVTRGFNVWMGDANLEVNFLFWETQRERLRCTVFYSDRAINGGMGNDRITIPAGTKVLGHTYDRRGADGQCGGAVRKLDTVSPEDMHITHKPGEDIFAIDASFTVDYEGTEVTVSLDARGEFINRPPIADFRLTGAGVRLKDDGCPVGVANTADGLEVAVRSTSHDPDGNFPEELDIKQSRVDISFEQWARSSPDGLLFLGEGQDIGTQLFETGKQHQLLLWVTDRQGAEARKICKFTVKEPS